MKTALVPVLSARSTLWLRDGRKVAKGTLAVEEDSRVQAAPGPEFWERCTVRIGGADRPVFVEVPA